MILSLFLKLSNYLTIKPSSISCIIFLLSITLILVYLYEASLSLKVLTEFGKIFIKFCILLNFMKMNKTVSFTIITDCKNKPFNKLSWLILMMLITLNNVSISKIKQKLIHNFKLQQLLLLLSVWTDKYSCLLMKTCYPSQHTFSSNHLPIYQSASPLNL